MFYTYIIQSTKDKRFYTGSTGDLRKRLNEHNTGKVFSTKNRGPFELIYYEACLNEQDARAREKYLKPCARNLIYMLKNLTLSIDYGGTWVRLVLTNKKNKKIRRLKIPSIPLDQIPHLIQSALNQWKVNQCSQLKIGAKGVWKKKNKRMLALKLKKLAKTRNWLLED